MSEADRRDRPPISGADRRDRSPISEADLRGRSPISEADLRGRSPTSEAEYVELVDLERVEEVEPDEVEAPARASGPASLPTIDVDVDIEVEQAGGHFQLVEVDALAGRGEYEAALARLLGVHGLPPGDARLSERLASFGRELGRTLAARGTAGEATPAELRDELRRLLRLAPDAAYRESLREEAAAAAAADHVERARGLRADGHLAAAVTVVETALALGRRVTELREARREAVRALVARAFELQQAGDGAFRRGDAAAAAAHWEEALDLLENDRLLLARRARVRGAG